MVFHIFSSRDIVFKAIKRLTQRAEKFVRDRPARENDKDWIQRKLQEGKFLNVRDISQPQSTSTKDSTPDSTPLSPKRTDSPIEEDLGRGKRTKFHKSNCDLECCDANVRRALFVDDLEIQQAFGEPEQEAIPDDGDPDYIVVEDDESETKPPPKTPRPSFKNVIALQARFNTPDNQVALWWNMVSL